VDKASRRAAQSLSQRCHHAMGTGTSNEATCRDLRTIRHPQRDNDDTPSPWAIDGGSSTKVSQWWRCSSACRDAMKDSRSSQRLTLLVPNHRPCTVKPVAELAQGGARRSVQGDVTFLAVL
jgi:hypothetical protein